MSFAAPVTGAALLLWALGIAGTAIWVATLASRRSMPLPTTPREAKGVLLVRPCAGAEANLSRWLGSTAELQECVGLKVVVAVPSASDPAYLVALQAAEGLASRGIDASVEITTEAGPNNKAAQLAFVVARAEPGRDIVVVADSDVDLSGVSIGALVEPIRARPEVGAVWAPAVEVPLEATLGDRISAAVLGGSLHAFPVLALLDRSGMVGKLFAVRRTSLTNAGGFEGLCDVLGEDVELARRLRATGREVVRAGFNARSGASGRRVGAVIARFARWMSVVRAQRPALLLAYPLLFCPTIPILLAASIAPSSLSACAVGLALMGRWIFARVAARECELAAPSVLMMAAADLVLLAALGRALATRHIRWRDRRLRLVRGGHLVDAASSPHAPAALRAKRAPQRSVAVGPRSARTSR